MPYTLPPFESIPLAELERSEVIEVLVWADGVVDAGPRLQLRPVLSQIRVDLPDLVELLAMRPLGALDVALQLRATGWDHEEGHAPSRAGRLKGAVKLTAPIDL